MATKSYPLHRKSLRTQGNKAVSTLVANILVYQQDMLRIRLRI